MLKASRVKLGSIQPAQVTVLEQRVAEKRQFTMANLLPTEALCQFGVEPVRERGLVLDKYKKRCQQPVSDRLNH